MSSTIHALSWFQTGKTWVVLHSGIERDAWHVFVGMAVYIGSAVVGRLSLGNWRPWVLAVLVAMLGEALDWRDDLHYLGYWRYADSLHDLLDTLLFPSLICLLAKRGWLKA